MGVIYYSLQGSLQRCIGLTRFLQSVILSNWGDVDWGYIGLDTQRIEVWSKMIRAYAFYNNGCIHAMKAAADYQHQASVCRVSLPVFGQHSSLGDRDCIYRDLGDLLEGGPLGCSADALKAATCFYSCFCILKTLPGKLAVTWPGSTLPDDTADIIQAKIDNRCKVAMNYDSTASAVRVSTSRRTTPVATSWIGMARIQVRSVYECSHA